MAVTEWDGATFEAHRPLLFSIAYRMLGCASGAEDVIQDTWLRISRSVTARTVGRTVDLASSLTTAFLVNRKASWQERGEYAARRAGSPTWSWSR